MSYEGWPERVPQVKATFNNAVLIAQKTLAWETQLIQASRVLTVTIASAKL